MALSRSHFPRAASNVNQKGDPLRQESFRFPSRFHLYFPVFATVAPVSCRCGLYLAVTVTVWHCWLPVAYCVAAYPVG